MQNILQDELGRIITLTDDGDMRMRGLQCIKASAQIVSNIAQFLCTSLGPFGRDKLLVDCDGSVIISNDGATILKHMELDVPVAKLILKLSEALDDEIGDGTTSVVIFANALLQNAVDLIQKGLHPTCITQGFEKASLFLLDHLERISDPIDSFQENHEHYEPMNAQKTSIIDEKNFKDSDSIETQVMSADIIKNPLADSHLDLQSKKSPKICSKTLGGIKRPKSAVRKFLINAARTSLNSKIVSKSVETFAEMCVDAVLYVFDHARHDLNFDLIKIHANDGADLSTSKLFHGVVLNKEVSHPEMPNSIQNAKFAILACPLEPPKMKTKYTVAVNNVEDFNALYEFEKNVFLSMVETFKRVGANVVICQWGFDDEANSLLAQNGILAVRWVGGTELEQVAVQTNGNIVARIESLHPSDLGTGSIQEITLGTEKDKAILIQGSSAAKMTTLCLRATNQIILEEVKRSVHDALCAVRNLLVSRKVTYGGGASEISCSLALRKECAREDSPEVKECFLAVSRAMEEIPFHLAMNVGADPVNSVASIKESQISSGNHFLGVSIDKPNGECMKSLNVYDALISKQKQVSMAIQLACSIVKIDDIITSGSQN